MTPDRRQTGARFDGRPISKGQFPTMTRRNGLRTAGASLLMAGLIATGVGVTAPEVVSAPVQTALQWAGPNVGHGTESSINWAGYGVSGGTFTKVAGSWVQPGVTCPTKLSEGAAFWVGIDGLVSTDKTVEQIGTDSDCVAKSGPSYYAWYEMLPKKFSRPAPFEVSGGGGRNHRCAGFGDGQGLHTDHQCHVGWRAEMARHNQNDRHHGAEGIVRRVDSRSPLRRIFVQEGRPTERLRLGQLLGALGRRSCDQPEGGVHRHRDHHDDHRLGKCQGLPFSPLVGRNSIWSHLGAQLSTDI